MTTTPSPDNLYVGAGHVFFDRYVSGAPSGTYRHLGNVESLVINSTINEITKKSAMDGDRGILARINTGTEVQFKMVLDEYEKKNLALALLGDVSTFTQDSDTLTDEDLNDGDAIELDVWYPLAGTNPTVTAINATITNVKQGVTTLNPDDDYEVNAAAGLIRILSTGAGTAAATTWSGTIPGKTGSQIFGSADSRIVGALRYVSATNQAIGPKFVIDVWKLSVRPDGDLQLIAEDFGSFTLAGTVEQDTTKAAGQRYFRVIETDDLEVGS